MAQKTLQINSEQAMEILRQMSDNELTSQFAELDPLLYIHKYVGTEFGTKLSFEKRPYLVKIIRDFSEHIVYKKSAQVGITMCGGIAKIIYAADIVGTTCIYTFPTARDVSEFSKGRFRYIIQNSKYLTSLIAMENEGLIRIRDTNIYFRGTWTDRQAISVPSMLNVHDELDFSKPGVRSVYSSRLDAANFMYKGEEQFGWEWDFSTPTLPRYGVSALYEDSDQHEWYVRCQGCNRRQRVDFFKNMRTKGKGIKLKHYFGCRKCDKELDRTQGWWVSRKPNAQIRGYHITQPMCAFISAAKMQKDFDGIKTAEDERKFNNFNLGLEYEDATEVVTRDSILNRVMPGTLDKGPIYMGIDQGNTLHIVVAKIIDGRRRYIFFGTSTSFSEVAQMIVAYQPRVCVIDGLPNTHNARELTDVLNGVYVAFYGGKKELKKEAWKTELEKNEVVVPRTEALDSTVSQWNKGEVVIENTIPLPMIEEFADQMTNAKRMLVDTTDGQKKAVWVPVGEDHFRHADVYCSLAMEIGTKGYNTKMRIAVPDYESVVTENIFTESETW